MNRKSFIFQFFISQNCENARRFSAKVCGNRSDLKSFRIWEKKAFRLPWKKHDKSNLSTEKIKEASLLSSVIGEDLSR